MGRYGFEDDHLRFWTEALWFDGISRRQLRNRSFEHYHELRIRIRFKKSLRERGLLLQISRIVEFSITRSVFVSWIYYYYVPTFIFLFWGNFGENRTRLIWITTNVWRWNNYVKRNYKFSPLNYIYSWRICNLWW